MAGWSTVVILDPNRVLRSQYAKYLATGQESTLRIRVSLRGSTLVGVLAIRNRTLRNEERLYRCISKAIAWRMRMDIRNLRSRLPRNRKNRANRFVESKYSLSSQDILACTGLLQINWREGRVAISELGEANFLSTNIATIPSLLEQLVPIIRTAAFVAGITSATPPATSVAAGFVF